MRWTPCALVVLLLGCDKLDAALPALAMQKRAPQGAEAAERAATAQYVDRARDSQQRLGKELSQLRGRLTLPALPASLPDCSVAASSLTQDAPLATAYVDARVQSKNLIPRRVAERLESEDMSELLHAAELLEGRTPEELSALEAAIEIWSKRRYIGVFYVTDYAGPALILRVGELKRSWMAGRVTAKFALLDTQEQRLLCADSLHVANDTKDSPIRSRLQSDTRIKLERELAARLLGAAREGWATRRMQLSLDLPLAVTTPPSS